MFILDIIVDVVDDLPQLKYRHDLAVCHIMDGVGNHVSLLIKPPLSIVRVDGYILLNKPGESKDHVDTFQVCGNKRAGGSNCTISGINCLKDQLVLIVSPQGMTGEYTERLRNGFTGPKIQLF